METGYLSCRPESSAICCYTRIYTLYIDQENAYISLCFVALIRGTDRQKDYLLHPMSLTGHHSLSYRSTRVKFKVKIIFSQAEGNAFHALDHSMRKSKRVFFDQNFKIDTANRPASCLSNSRSTYPLQKIYQLLH